VLELRDNSLKMLPLSLTSLARLQVLDLSSNFINSLVCHFISCFVFYLPCFDVFELVTRKGISVQSYPKPCLRICTGGTSLITLLYDRQGKGKVAIPQRSISKVLISFLRAMSGCLLGLVVECATSRLSTWTGLIS